LLTGSRDVSFLVTLETETVSTHAVDVCVSAESVSLDELVAVLIGTPFDASVLICEISTVPI